jgi:Mg2+ and Co2+ transporter CorA
MTGKPTYEDLEKKIKQLELEILEYQRKDKVLNEDLAREIKKRKRLEKELKQVSKGLGERIKELNCLYSISKLRERTDFSLEDILQAIVDLIPSAWQYPEITCARIRFDGYEFTTNNYKSSGWKLTREIMVYSEKIGTLEVCYLEEKLELDEGPFLREERKLIDAVAERIAKFIEREWAEEEIRKYRNRSEKHINSHNNT